MRRHSALLIGILSLATLTGCASGAADGVSVSPAPTSETPDTSQGPDAAARAQAQAWIDAATVPPDAVRSASAIGGFHSYQGWPCQPVIEQEAYWTISGMTVAETANWLAANPTADLVSTAVGTVDEEGDYDEATVGYIPADDSQQGVVYTVAKKEDGVAIRAEVAALTESAVCPSLPPGSIMGKPGQG
ncbi:hypothetical protein FHX49_002432 [Microbacterium endophyticum]|uniref:DUF3558 domain-containing protein n=1 Tax=Microbacterium endophyticum TaxID=1526412 RepID=A0A7W4V515_9MICO|nr:hypothetical protein [Microbacterium endophyticum]MBB2976844.1 hypothetical protein [Microbacterium endophyticum]NIK35838.1 hypothetical protein [Microbacterium endophyticum]